VKEGRIPGPGDRNEEGKGLILGGGGFRNGGELRRSSTVGGGGR